MIPYARQCIDQHDVRSVVEVLQSDWLTQGPAVERFEQAVAAHCRGTHAVAMNSATSALHAAYLTLGLGQGDVLWTSPNTFVATANMAVHCGADVDFVDIDPRTYNLSVDSLREKLVRAARTGRLPRIVVPVHFGGHPCELEAIADLGRQYGFRVVEDASHAVGAQYRESRIGDCRYSDITVLSFHPVKIITTGEGGMALTNDLSRAQTLRRLRSHGIVHERTQFVRGEEGPWYYEQQDLGFNYRMSDIQAALGASQVRRLDQFVARRKALAARYQSALSGLPVNLPEQIDGAASAWHLYVVQLARQRDVERRRQIVESLRAAGVYAHVHYIPVHLQPFYAARGFRAGDFPAAEQFYQAAITLPLYVGLSEEDQDAVSSALARVLHA